MIEACADILRNQVVALMCSLRGKIVYTQDKRRDDIPGGYGDCSSVIRWVYLQVMQIDIGEDTPAQITSCYGMDVDINDTLYVELRGIEPLSTDEKGYPNLQQLKKGDLLFFTGGSADRPYGVGHVEMYMGNGWIIGQNGRDVPGPFVKKLDDYMKYIDEQHLKYVKTRRFIC